MNVTEIALAVAKELGNLKVDTTKHNPSIYLPEGGYLWLRLDERKGRISVHGDYTFTKQNPDGTSAPVYGAPRQSEGDATISVAADRPPQAIARDIERRFLPVYRALYKVAKDRNDASNNYELASRETAACLSNAVGRTVSPARPGSGETSTYLGERRLEFYISGEEVYWLKASKLSREQAVKVIEFLKTL